MARYRNSGGDSGVIAYEIGDNFIKVQCNGRNPTLSLRPICIAPNGNPPHHKSQQYQNRRELYGSRLRSRLRE